MDMDEGMYSGSILIDLQKAFDTLDHKVLSKKMICLGFKRPAINFSEAGILNSVSLRGLFWDLSCFECILITYLSHYQNVFADDTCIFQQDKDVHKIEDKEEVEKVETTVHLFLRCPFTVQKDQNTLESLRKFNLIP